MKLSFACEKLKNCHSIQYTPGAAFGNVRYRIIPIYYVASQCSPRAATTHWSNLAERFQRGVGNPCPPLSIGPPSSIVAFDEDQKTIAALIEEGAAE
jgi:hypothetical protein